MSEILSIEHSTINASYMHLYKGFRFGHHKISQEIRRIKKLSSELERLIPHKSEILQFVDNILLQVQAVESRIEEAIDFELFVCNDLKTKVQHLNSFVAPENSASSLEVREANVSKWKIIRMDRMIVDHLLRRGYFETAGYIVNHLGICHLTNYDVFNPARLVEDDLAMHSTASCLKWCYGNKAELTKFNSNLEFSLHAQNFVELIRDNRCMDAVMYSRKFFPAFVETNLDEIKSVMALLAYNSKVNKLGREEFMYYTERWNELVLMFRSDLYCLFKLSKISKLNAAVNAGLAALKTKQCYLPHFRKPNCPVCQYDFNRIAANLPLAYYKQSSLICRITKLPINENNPPMMLPNGQVFGQLGIKRIRNRYGKIICPITGNKFTKLDKIEKVFIM